MYGLICYNDIYSIMDKNINMDINVYLSNITNKTIDDIYNDYKEYLNQEDLEKIQRFKQDLNRRQSLMSIALKKKYVKGEIYYNEYGKPLSKEIYFNISHSDNYVMIALSKDTSVGVDIEYIKDNVDDNLINHVCNDSEIEYINKDKSRNFYYIWTRKEAILKCIGSGITNDLKNINVINNSEYNLDSNYIDNYVYTIVYSKEIKISNINIFKEKGYE